MTRILMFGLGVCLLAGCIEHLPTDIVDEPAPAEAAQQASVVATSTQVARADALGGIDDALDRIVPALTDASAAQPLAAALGGLRNALSRVDANGVPALIAAAGDAVERYARTGLDIADLDAIRLGLDYASEVIAAAS